MKKLSVLIVLLSVCLLSSTYGQTVFRLKAGLNLSTIPNNRDHNTQHRLAPGFHAGISEDFKLSEHLGLQVEELLSMKGDRYSFSWNYLDFGYPDSGSAKGYLNLYYLDLPVLLTYKHTCKNVTCFIQAGPYASIGLWGRAGLKVSRTNQPTQTSHGDVKFGMESRYFYQTLDYGFTGGVGAEMKRWSAALRYSVNQYFWQPSGIHITRIQLLQLSLGWRV